MPLAASDAAVKGALIGLLVVLLIAAVVYFACRAVGRPDVGAPAACVVVILGAIFVLIDYL